MKTKELKFSYQILIFESEVLPNMHEDIFGIAMIKGKPYHTSTIFIKYIFTNTNYNDSTDVAAQKIQNDENKFKAPNKNTNMHKDKVRWRVKAEKDPNQKDEYGTMKLKTGGTEIVSGQYVLIQGQEIIVEIDLKPEYQITQVVAKEKINGVTHTATRIGNTNNYKFTMPNRNVDISFEAKKLNHDIRFIIETGVNVDEISIVNGTATISEHKDVPQGTTVTIKTSLNAGYNTEVVVNDGVNDIQVTEVTAGKKYTFIMPLSDVTVAVKYSVPFRYTKTATDVTITEYTGSEGTGTNVKIPEIIDGIKVTKIGQNAFENDNISTVQFPKNLKNVGLWAFKNSRLTEVTISPGITFGDAVFVFIPSLKDVTVEEGVTILPRDMFTGSDLSGVVKLPSTLTTIDRGVFLNTKLSKIDIPSKVTNIGVDVFQGDSLLEEMKVGYDALPGKATIPNIGSHAFYGAGGTNGVDNIYINKKYDDKNYTDMNAYENRFGTSKME